MIIWQIEKKENFIKNAYMAPSIHLTSAPA